MKRALVISYHFAPDPSIGSKRPTELVKFLVENGWKVTVLTKNYPAITDSYEQLFGDRVDFIRAPHLPGLLNPTYIALKKLTHKVRLGKNFRITNRFDPTEEVPKNRQYQSFSAKFWVKRLIISSQALLSATKGWLITALVLLVFHKMKGKRYNIVLSSSPPASVHLLAKIAKSLFGGRWILDLRDPINIWELVQPVCRAPYRVKIENWLERRYLREADRVVVTTELLQKEMQKIAKRENLNLNIDLIYNGYDGELVLETAELHETFELAFAGMLYANRNPFELFKAIRDLLESGNIQNGGIHLSLYGKCQSWNGYSIYNWIQENQLQDVITIHGMLSPHELEKKLIKTHLLVSFAQDQPLQIPAKTFDYIRYPCKSLVITENGSATATFVMRNGLGYASDDDRLSLMNTILIALDEYRQRSTLSSSKEDQSKRKIFSRTEQNKLYLDLIESMNE